MDNFVDSLHADKEIYSKYVDVYRYDSKIYNQICFMAYEDCSNISSIYKTGFIK
jgi:hypothetical protein